MPHKPSRRSVLVWICVLLHTLDRLHVLMAEGLRSCAKRCCSSLQLLGEFDQLGFSFLITGVAG